MNILLKLKIIKNNLDNLFAKIKDHLYIMKEFDFLQPFIHVFSINLQGH